MSDPAHNTRDDYPFHMPIQTRWSDNDIYGHVNNVTYYSYFDTVVNRYLIDEGGLDIVNGKVIGLAVETQCRFRDSVAYPDALTAGLRVAHVGTSSVRYEIGIFKDGPNGESDPVTAWGHFVHVFVDRATNKSVPIPDRLREALEWILMEPDDE